MADEINIEFGVIPNMEPKYMILHDTSIFPKGDIVKIKVKTPGSSIYKEYTHMVNTYTLFHTSNLGLSKVGIYCDMPDGIYCFKVEHKGKCVEKAYLRDVLLQIDLLKYYAKIDDPDEIHADIKRVEAYMKFYKSAEYLGKMNKAMDYYNRAKRILNRLFNCQTC